MIKKFRQWWQQRFIRAKRKAAAASGAQYYGSGMTIHGTGWIDVETRQGKVVAVWFRCCPLPFRQSEVEVNRAADMARMYPLQHWLNGVETVSKKDASR